MAYRNVDNTLPMQVTSDAEFRTRGALVNAQLAAMGLVQTADTGQINWTTVTKPGVGSTVAGYEIWRFADALQSTKPVFFKLEYGSGVGANTFGFWLTVGTGSNGSGSLTGATTTRQQCAPTNSPNALNHLKLFSGSTNYVIVCMDFWASDGGSNVRVAFFAIERKKTAAGALDSAGGVYVYMKLAGGNVVTEYFDHTIGGVGQEATTGIMVPRVGNGTNGSDINTYPCYLSYNFFLPAGLVSLGYNINAMPENVTVTIPMYGSDHTYYPLGDGFATTQANRAGVTNHSLLVLYDN